MLEPFLQRLRSIHKLSPEFEEAIRALEIIEAPRGTVLLRDGQCEDYVWIVLKGVLRSYYIKDGEEICSRFNSENQIVLSVVSFYSRKPGYEFVETIEDSTLARIHHDRLQEFYRDFPEFNFIGRVLTEYYFTLSEQRLYLLRKQSAEERYRFFMEHYPEWLQRVPLKYVATFLGMNLETLSRIRKKISGDEFILHLIQFFFHLYFHAYALLINEARIKARNDSVKISSVVPVTAIFI